MMAENLASRDGRPVLERVAGRETFSFSWCGGGGGRREAGGGGPVGGGGGARRFLPLLDAEAPMGLELTDGTLFCTLSARDPSNRLDQFATSSSCCRPIRKRPSVSSILLWMRSAMPSNLPGEVTPAHEATVRTRTAVRETKVLLPLSCEGAARLYSLSSL